MSESPTEDLVYPAKVAMTGLSSSRELVGHFTRVFLSLLNSSEKHLSLLHPFDVAEIVHALGYLGAKHSTESASTTSTHRRLRLFASLPCFKKDELEDLPDKALVRMVSFEAKRSETTAHPLLTVIVKLSGLAALSATEASYPTIMCILEILEGRVESLSGKSMIQCISCLSSLQKSPIQSPGTTEKENTERLETQYDNLLTLISFHFAPLVPSLDTTELAEAMMHLVVARSPRDEIVLGIESEVQKRVSILSEQHHIAPETSLGLTIRAGVEPIAREQFALGRCAELINSYRQKFKPSVDKG